MYVGVDVGGTKTLVAAISDDGRIRKRTQFLTPKDYGNFILELRHSLAHLDVKDFQAGAAGIPATVMDRENGRGVRFGNLPWRNAPVQADLEKICKCPIVVENDAKLAALSEAALLKDRYSRVLYITISTGIGIGLVVNGEIDINIGDGGGRTIMLEHGGKIIPWEDFASGRAITEQYGKQAKDITDKTTWKAISHGLAQGLIHLIGIVQPDVIVIGGGVGAYFDHFEDSLKAEIEAYKIPMVKIPHLIKAQRAKEAVIFGCYDIAKQRFSHG